MKKNFKVGLAMFALFVMSVSTIFADLNEDLLVWAYNSNEEKVKELVQQGADINAKVTSFGVPLVYAVNGNYKGMVEVLLKCGADVNVNNGEPLIVAVEKDNESMVEMLLKHGANVNVNKGQPLIIAMRKNNENIAEMLLKHGADVNDIVTSSSGKWQPETTDNGYSRSSSAANDRTGWDIAKLDTARDVNYLTDIEKDVVLEHNMVRSNPKKYAEMYVKPILSDFSGTLMLTAGLVNIRTEEGAAAVKKCYDVLCKTKPLGILQPAEKLSEMALWHAETHGEKGLIGHNSADGSSSDERKIRFLGTRYYVGENISYGENSARAIVLQLLIDDGVKSRGHRNNILDGDYKSIGVGFAFHKTNKYTCVLDYSSQPSSTYTSNRTPASSSASTNKTFTSTYSNFGIDDLVKAVGGGDFDTVKKCVDAGVDVNGESGERLTVLFSASTPGCAEVVKYLISKMPM